LAKRHVFVQRPGGGGGFGSGDGELGGDGGGEIAGGGDGGWSVQPLLASSSETLERES